MLHIYIYFKRSSLNQSSEEERSEGTEIRKETRAALSLGFLMGAFLVCWLPFFIWMPLVTVMVWKKTEKEKYWYIIF